MFLALSHRYSRSFFHACRIDDAHDEFMLHASAAPKILVHVLNRHWLDDGAHVGDCIHEGKFNTGSLVYCNVETACDANVSRSSLPLSSLLF